MRTKEKAKLLSFVNTANWRPAFLFCCKQFSKQDLPTHSSTLTKIAEVAKNTILKIDCGWMPGKLLCQCPRCHSSTPWKAVSSGCCTLDVVSSMRRHFFVTTLYGLYFQRLLGSFSLLDCRSKICF